MPASRSSVVVYCRSQGPTRRLDVGEHRRQAQGPSEASFVFPLPFLRAVAGPLRKACRHRRPRRLRNCASEPARGAEALFSRGSLGFRRTLVPSQLERRRKLAVQRTDEPWRDTIRCEMETTVSLSIAVASDLPMRSAHLLRARRRRQPAIPRQSDDRSRPRLRSDQGEVRSQRSPRWHSRCRCFISGETGEKTGPQKVPA